MIKLPPPDYRRLSDLQSGIDESYSPTTVRRLIAEAVAAERERCGHLVPGMMPLSAGLPPWDESASVLVYTEHDDWSGVQFHQVKVLDLYPPQDDEQSSDEVADAATHWMPLPFPQATALEGAPAREPSDEEIDRLATHGCDVLRTHHDGTLSFLFSDDAMRRLARAVRAWPGEPT